MLSTSLSTIAFLFTALIAGTTHALPISGDSVLKSRATKDSCVSTIARLEAADQASAAKDCFKELAPHVFVGGKTGVLNSGSGAHLASSVLRSNPNKAGRVHSQTLIMQASVTDATKTLWLDDGLKPLIQQAHTAQTDRTKAQTNVEKAQQAVDAQKARIKASKTATNGDKKKLKTLQNALKKAEGAVTKPTELETAMVRLDGEIADQAKLYTKASIKDMCVDAMKLSFAQHQGLLKGGTFSVTASNLGAKVNVRLLEANSRINSCFPVVRTCSNAGNFDAQTCSYYLTSARDREQIRLAIASAGEETN